MSAANTVLTASLALGLALPAAAFEDRIPVRFSCQINAVAHSVAQGFDPFNPAVANKAAEGIGGLTSLAGAILATSSIQGELVQLKDVATKTSQVQILERYRDQIIEVRNLQSEIDKARIQINDLSSQIDVVESGRIMPRYNAAATKRSASIRSRMVTLEGDLQMAQESKARLLLEVIAKTQIKAMSDDQVLRELGNFERRQFKARDWYEASRTGRMGTLGAGVGLFIGGVAIYLSSESLARNFAELRSGEMLSEQQVNDVEQMLDCALFDGHGI